MEKDIKAMVFAAGLGTRLRPLTDTMPKALVPVGGRPLLDFILGKLEAYGFHEAVVNAWHFASQIDSYLSGRNGTVRTSLSDERGVLSPDGPLETGGGIIHARPLLEQGGCSRFLVHNADILSNLDFDAFIQAAPEDAAATLAVSRRETSRYFLFDSGNHLCGWKNVSTGEVRSPYPGLDPSSCNILAFSGIHLVSVGIFSIYEALESEPEAFPLYSWHPGEDPSRTGAGNCGPLGKRFSVVDLYLRICGRYPVYAFNPGDLRLMDVGKAGSLPLAEGFIRDNPLCLGPAGRR